MRASIALWPATVVFLMTLTAGVFADEDATIVEDEREPEYQQFAARVDKVLKASGTEVVVKSSAHVTLICNPSLTTRYMRDVKQLERMLEKRFPAPIGSGPDKRNANIALFSTHYEYESWIRALFKVLEDEGMRWEEWDAADRAARTQRFLAPGIFHCCLEKMKRQGVRHAIAYAVGYHYLEQATLGNAPVTLKTGFGNVAEVMLLGNPTMVLNSGYAERNLGQGRTAWTRIVKRRFAQNSVPPISDVLNYATSAMQLPQYTECWSLTTFLARSPDKLSSLALALRNEEPTLAAIEKCYGMDAKKLHASWKKFAIKARSPR